MATKYDGKKAAKRMLVVYLLLFIGAGTSIIWALINTQMVNGEKWRKMAMNRERDLKTDMARRGNIYSSDGNILATTLPVCDLYLDLGRKEKKDAKGHTVRDTNNNPIIETQLADSLLMKGIDAVAVLLSEDSKVHSAAYYKEKILNERAKEHPSQCFLIQRGIAYSTWEAIRETKGWGRAVVRKVDDHSVIHQERAHIYGNMGENTIGFRNSRLSNSYTGLEGYYDSVLRGQDGQYWCRRLTRGVWIKSSDQTSHYAEFEGTTVDSTIVKERIDGSDIVATIDTRYQDVAESSLRKALRTYGANSGCAILMEMETGYILACSNLIYDTNVHEYMELSNNNIACSDLYEPGSTFKSVLLTAMMNDTSIVIDTAEKVRVGYKIFSKYSGEINDGSHATLDTVSVAKVIAMSSNVGMCEIGWKNYRTRRNDLKEQVMKIFPFAPLKLDVKTGEYPGTVNDLTPDRDFLNFCYGYSAKVSAMQVLTFYNALGAGGRMVKPLFCRGIMENGKLKPFEPVVLNERICSPETARIMKELLVGVVENGTGNNIKNNTYGIAGKTGTAVFSYQNQHIYTASFAGFFPAENPKYTCLVVVKRVAAHGRQAAAPVFKDIADCVVAVDKELGYVKLKSNPEDNQKKMLPAPVGRQKQLQEAYASIGQSYNSTTPEAEWVMYVKPQDTVETFEGYQLYKWYRGVVPDCTGMTVREALALLHEVGLQAKVEGCGKVVSQYPKSGTKIPAGNQKVTLKLEL